MISFPTRLPIPQRRPAPDLRLPFLQERQLPIVSPFRPLVLSRRVPSAQKKGKGINRTCEEKKEGFKVSIDEIPGIIIAASFLSLQLRLPSSQRCELTFIASKTTKTSPSLTSSPTLHLTSTTLLGIGA